MLFWAERQFYALNFEKVEEHIVFGLCVCVFAIVCVPVNPFTVIIYQPRGGGEVGLEEFS